MLGDLPGIVFCKKEYIVREKERDREKLETVRQKAGMSMWICKTINLRRVQLDAKEVLKSFECAAGERAYEEALVTYKKYEPWFLANVRPKAILALEDVKLEFLQKYSAKKEYTNLLYEVLTLGNQAENESEQLFARGEYLAGMLLDTMADLALFHAEEALLPEIKKLCIQASVGVGCRMQAPADFTLDIHRYLADRCHLKENLGVEVTDGCMFYPVKTMCTIYGLVDDSAVFHAEHDCRACLMQNCKFRDILRQANEEGKF